MPVQIKTSDHTTKFANTGKRSMLSLFLADYRSAVDFYVNHIWSNRFETKDGVFDICEDKYDLPKYLPLDKLEFDTNLSARALKCAMAQAVGIVKSVTRKIQKLKYTRNVIIEQGKDTAKIDERIDKFSLSKPEIGEEIYANLCSICAEFIPCKETKQFDGFLMLFSIGKKYGRIYIPIKFHRHTIKLINSGYEIKTSWLIGKNKVCSIWDRQSPEKKHEGNKVGADQGIVDCLTLSDGQITPIDAHGHTLRTIMKKLEKKTKGSKGYKKAQQHRTNYINWSINQLDFTEIRELGFEDVKNLRTGKNTSAFMKSWTYTEIALKIEDKCLNEGVLLSKQGSVYRSQRCYSCGFVHNKNRNKKTFKCRNCGHETDADLNGALNHSTDIRHIPYSVMRLRLNKQGFFWKEHGLFNLDGEEISVPLDNETDYL